MARMLVSVCFVLAGLLVACGGGSSPTAPDPAPDSLAGTWPGEMSGTVDGAAFTCPLLVELRDEGDGIFLGDWDAECPGGGASGLATAFTFAGLTVLNGLALSTTPATHPLGTCGWGAPVTLRGSELSGDWQPPDNCVDTSPGRRSAAAAVRRLTAAAASSICRTSATQRSPGATRSSSSPVTGAAVGVMPPAAAAGGSLVKSARRP